ncbi:MAG TPA: hypothetical protein VMZ28_22185 [Kofleriaceae bacterium]|nr:hypothetical protein [Kofleriaceae bacterium]
MRRGVLLVLAVCFAPGVAAAQELKSSGSVAVHPRRTPTGDAEVVLTCRSSGGQILVDGLSRLVCPATITLRLAPGTHRIRAHKPGYSSPTHELIVLAGERRAIEIGLTAGPGHRLVQRWDTWVPWGVAGGGAALALTGGLLLARSSRNFDAYDEAVARRCADTGCSADEIADLDDLESRAELQNRLGVTALLLGGAGIVAGTVMIYLNEPRIVAEPPGRLVWSPLLAPDAVGLAAAARF